MKMIAFLFIAGTLFSFSSQAAGPQPQPFVLPWHSAIKTSTLKMATEPFKDEAVFRNSFVIYNECAGEEIEVTQTVYFRLVWIVNNNRNNSHVNIRREGIGIGLTTGTQYNFHGNYNDVANASINNGQYSFGLVENYHLVAPGPNNNLSFHIMAKYIVNANGEVIIDEFFPATRSSCR